MQIRVRSTGQVIFDHEFRQLHAATSMPFDLTEEVLNDWGGDLVFEGPQATGGTVYQYSQYDGVEQKEDGKWYTKYILGPVFTDRAAEGDMPAATAAEQETAYRAIKDAEKAAEVREQRNTKLKASDWTQLADSTANKQAWATHRQALRDISSQSGFPWTIVWPDAVE
jgi:hypothetical protein